MAGLFSKLPAEIITTKTESKMPGHSFISHIIKTFLKVQKKLLRNYIYDKNTNKIIFIQMVQLTSVQVF